MRLINFLIIFMSFAITGNYASKIDSIRCQYVIDKTNANFQKVKNYTVDISVELDIPGIRMPKSNYVVSFNQPDQIEIKSKEFGILPKTGLFESPEENFNNLEDKVFILKDESLIENEVMVEGYAIFDSLKFASPNAYLEMLEPIVRVKVDTLNWVINSVVASIETRKKKIPLFQIENIYNRFDSEFFMPVKSTAKYYIKDKKLSNWLSKDSDYLNQMKQSQNSDSESIVEGTIEVKYSNYVINKND